MDQVLKEDYFDFTLKLAKELYGNGKIVESLMCFVYVVPFIENLSPEERHKIVSQFEEDDYFLGSIADKLEKMGKIELSEIARKIFLLFDPSDLQYWRLGKLYLDQNLFLKSKLNLIKAIELMQDSSLSSINDEQDESEIRELLGQAYLGLEEYENAIINLSSAKEIVYKIDRDSMQDLWIYGGNTLLQNIYLSLYDDYFPKHYTDFCLLLLHKAIFEGEEYSNEFLSKVYRRRGECFINKGDLKESAFCFNKVLEFNPIDTYAKNMLSTIEKLQSEKEEPHGTYDKPY